MLSHTELTKRLCYGRVSVYCYYIIVYFVQIAMIEIAVFLLVFASIYFGMNFFLFFLLAKNFSIVSKQRIYLRKLRAIFGIEKEIFGISKFVCGFV